MTLFNTAETLLLLENGILKAPASSLKMQCTASLNHPLPLDHHFYTLNPEHYCWQTEAGEKARAADRILGRS